MTTRSAESVEAEWQRANGERLREALDAARTHATLTEAVIAHLRAISELRRAEFDGPARNEVLRTEEALRSLVGEVIP